MRKALSVGWKEVRQISRDRRSLVLLLFVPAFFLLVYGYALNWDIRHVRLAVDDRDRSEASRSLVSAFVNSGYFDLVADVSGGRQIDELMNRGAARAVLVIPAGLIALGEERERRLQQQVQAEALSRSNELKTALLRAVSHDMRSPLMAITTAAGGLRYARLDGDDRELLETITDQSSRMSRMIENLLDLSKLQAGAAAARADWLDPRELVEAAVDELMRGGQQEPPLVLDFAHDPPLVRGDASQLQRVLVNLLENALKFSPPGSEVRVEVRHTGPDVEIAVADHGPGIPAEEADRIFEPFHRGSADPQTPGSGLGLAIARGLAAANGCRLTLDSQPGAGSRFVLALPLPHGDRRP
jgi:two-component system, OmpR family, sensor histidine kinase KdpD